MKNPSSENTVKELSVHAARRKNIYVLCNGKRSEWSAKSRNGRRFCPPD